MPPTRVIRSNTIANIADFGAIPADPAAAAVNSLAFAAAFATGARRVCVPAGVWYYKELTILGNPWLPPDTELFGEGRERSFLRYVPTDETTAAIRFSPHPLESSRDSLHDLQIIGPLPLFENKLYGEPGIYPRCVGISAARAQFSVIHDVTLWDFQVGIDLDPDLVHYPDTFTGYTTIERFEINRCTTGIRMHDATNGVRIASGRVFHALELVGSGALETDLPVREERGTGISIKGTVFSNGPGGGSGIVLSQVTVEPAALCLEIANSHDIVVMGCYFEPKERTSLDNTLVGTRRIADIDAVSERLVFLGNVASGPGINGIPRQHWTPNYVSQAPEARGCIDLNAFHDSGDSHTLNAYGAGIHGATAAQANLVRNGDMSRELLFWTPSSASPFVQVKADPGDFVIGGRSLQLESTSDVTDHLAQDFVVDHGVRSITANVRYRFQPEITPPSAFRVELVLLVGSLEDPTEVALGFYSDTAPEDLGWRVRSLTARFDGADAGVVGPVRLRIKLYPYNVNVGPAVPGQQVVVDSVWVVDGEYAAPYRPYAEGVEVLAEGSRPTIVEGADVTAPLAETGLPPGLLVPSNAVGMVTEVSIRGTDAFLTDTFVKIRDNGTTAAGAVRDIYAYVNDRPTVAEFTMPLGGGPTWAMFGASVSNLVSYHVRVKAWIYRL